MSPTRDLFGAKILVVDDKEANVMLLDGMLRTAGYTNVSTTRNPRDVCALQRRDRYSLILLDLHMPGMSGFEVLDELTSLDADDYAPVLVITAQPVHKLRALQEGARDFISSPFELDEMLLRVRNMLEVRLLHEAARDHGKAQESLAVTDALTGLANRRLLEDRLVMAVAHARREQGSMATIYLDLDGFKEINDTLGHASGDTLLKMVADRLTATVREEDTVARLGGDEFVIVLRVSGAADAERVAGKVIDAVAKPYVIGAHAASVTVSAGIGLYPSHGEDAETLLKSADRALYEAKRSGKNNYRVAVQ